ncbi:MAG TPA: Tol-Pal system beta propeller repeat protein TolB [Steroidobacteraceae bacterium]|nr:Tol-Pal system beta propeller repeat protein TolB [Steroidobacteraceae bacterium]
MKVFLVPAVRSTLVLLAWLACATSARAELQIDITKGVTDPIPIGVVPFATASAGIGGYDFAAVVQRDLDGSGRFKTMERSALRVRPTRAADVVAADWHAEGADYVLVGRVMAAEGVRVSIECDLVNALTGQLLGTSRVLADPANPRAAAHRVSDFVFEKIIGTRGAFATRIAYVAVDGTPPAQHFQLIVADADGENSQVVLDSRQPIMSPAWSADGQWLAYVSFENRVAAVIVQQLRTGERRQVSARAGVNGAPSWSPNGKRLALTLSGSGGNLDIFVLDLATQALTRITDDPAIDTEPAWSPDGASVYFTSDRSGGPQIYRTDVAGHQRVQRITFGSSYDARPRPSPDGRSLALVSREGSDYRIAVQDLASGNVRVLTHGNLDESPSFAPNGMSLIYAGRVGSAATLATVAVDGQVSQQLKSNRGDVREPVWGPFVAP